MKIFTDNVKVLIDDMEQLYCDTYKCSSKELLEQIKDRSISLNDNGGEFGDAYTSAAGRFLSVDTGSSTATFNTNKYERKNAIISQNLAAYLSKGSTTYFFGVSITANKNIKKLIVTKHSLCVGSNLICWLHTSTGALVDGKDFVGNVATFNVNLSAGATYFLQVRNGGSTYTAVTLANNTTIINDIFTINYGIYNSVTTGVTNMYNFTNIYAEEIPTNEYISHIIPVYSIPSNINTCFAHTSIIDFETGNTVQYKLTNETESTNWLNFGELSSFTAFTYQPTRFLIKLGPSSTGTDGYPSVSGFTVLSDVNNKTGGKAVFMSGYNGSSNLNTIDYIFIPIIGNATDFGDLNISKRFAAGSSSVTRGVIGGGYTSTTVNTIEYITIDTSGNSVTFGNLTQSRRYPGSLSNNIRGIWVGGYVSSTYNIIDYITIATTGNAIDFGDILTSSYGLCGSSSKYKGIIYGGAETSNLVNFIEYIIISTTSNSTNFGDSTIIRYLGGSFSSNIRSCLAGGDNSGVKNVIDYINIDTLSNAIDFGDLTSACSFCCGTSNGITGIIALGYVGGVANNTINSVIISTTANATDFGDLSVTRYSLVAVSDSHGGLV